MSMPRPEIAAPSASPAAPRGARVRPLLVAGVALAAALALLACDGGRSVDEPNTIGGGSNAPLDIDCVTGVSEVLAGGSSVPVFARVTRGNLPVSGATVTFIASRGLIQPSEVVSDAEGMATASYTPPGTAGNARIDMAVTDRRLGDTASTNCTIGVVSPRDPRLNVQLIVPDSAAGLEIRVQYDPSRVDLPAGAARASGSFAGGSCITLANDNGFGIVDLDIACSATQTPSGSVATFDFVHVAGPELTAGDFAVSCAAFDLQGRGVGAACTASVTQL